MARATTPNIVSHSGIQQEERLHNLVRIDAGRLAGITVPNAPRCNLLAMGDDARMTYALADVTPVYKGKRAVSKVEREFLFLRPDAFVVFDRVDTAGPDVSRVWTLNVPAEPAVAGDRLTLKSQGHRMDVFPSHPAASPTWCPATASTWPTPRAPAPFLHVFGLDGSVASVARSDAAGQTGVQITFADGRSATVRFSTEGRGGTLDLRAAGGASLFSGPLPTTVASLPLFAR